MRWLAPEIPDIPPDFVKAIGGSQLVGEVLYRRGITEINDAKAFIDPDHFSPSPPDDLNGLVFGADIIQSAIRRGKRIGVWGDFDVDGQTATTLLVTALEKLGGQVEFHIPDRELESHGINQANLDKMIGLGIDVLVTCDTGISAHTPIAYAKKNGLQVVITDHHDLPPQLPVADSIINPKMLDENHPLRFLPGVGVAYKLIEHLFAKNGLGNLVEQYLDLVALGIVADIAHLGGDTRYLLQRGLSTLQRTDRLGLKVLYENAGLNPEYISEDDIGFSIAPRLNSLGRLSNANLAVEFLTTSDESRARVIGNQLEGLNAERRLLTNQVYTAINEKIKDSQDLNSSAVLVVEGENWPGGVLGLAAGRLVERYKKPALVLSSTDGESYSGSARSINGVNISIAISQCSDLLDQFGGHPMAAGVSLQKKNLKKFRSRLSSMVASQKEAEQVKREKIFDFEVTLEEISQSLAEEISILSPFGLGNPPVVLVVKGIKIVSQAVIGRGGEHLKLIIEDQNKKRETVYWWRGVERSLPTSWCNLALLLKKNVFQGVKQLQLEVVDIWVDDKPAIELESPKIEVFDFRQRGKTQNIKNFIREKKDTSFLWSEVVEIEGFTTVGRSGAQSADHLFVISLPPSQDVFIEVLKIVNPSIVYFLGINPGVDDFTSFLSRLGGLCKYALKSRGGVIDLQDILEGTAQSEVVVQKGLEWFIASGELKVQEIEHGIFQIGLSEGRPTKDPGLLAKVEGDLRKLLNESKAYRNFLSALSYQDLIVYIAELVN
jgi:single-stranded-DNA-specific exonuclease